MGSNGADDTPSDSCYSSARGSVREDHESGISDVYSGRRAHEMDISRSGACMSAKSFWKASYSNTPRLSKSIPTRNIASHNSLEDVAVVSSKKSS